MTEGSGKSFDLSRGEGIPSFSDIWGVGEPHTFADAERVRPLMVNRMAWVLTQHDKAERANAQAQVSLDIPGGNERLEGTRQRLETARMRRDRALMDVAEIFSPENPFCSREDFMDGVDQRLAREAQPA